MRGAIFDAIKYDSAKLRRITAGMRLFACASSVGTDRTVMVPIPNRTALIIMLQIILSQVLVVHI